MVVRNECFKDVWIRKDGKETAERYQVPADSIDSGFYNKTPVSNIPACAAYGIVLVPSANVFSIIKKWRKWLEYNMALRDME